MEDITDADYKHAKKYGKKLNKKLRMCPDFYVEIVTLFLADVYENTSKHTNLIQQSFSAPVLEWQACLKNKIGIRIIK